MRVKAVLAIFTMTALSLRAGPARAQDQGAGPATLVLSYKATPATRTSLHDHMDTKGVAQFEKWKKEGIFADYQILFSSYVNSTTWDMLIVLSFDKYADQARWKDIERKMPGGLGAEALMLGSPVTSYLADLTFLGAAPKPEPGKPVYFVIPYTYLVGRADYKTYVEAYVLPQTRGWVKAGVVTSYKIFLNQNETGDPWDALFILEYRDLGALALRRETIAKVRAVLSQDPGWKKIADNKQEVRKEGEIIIADPVVMR